MHPNPFTGSRGRRKATTKPAAASVPFRAADHLRNAKEITGYIEAMLADGDALAVPIALRTVADALGVDALRKLGDVCVPKEVQDGDRDTQGRNRPREEAV